MTFSEFGRTIVSNGSNGTDHGTAAPMFVFGNKVDASVLGSNPNIPSNITWQAQKLRHNTNNRQEPLLKFFLLKEFFD